MSTSDALSQIIRRELSARGMADAEFARRAGWTKATMSRKMSGASKFFVEDAVIVADVLGWSTAHLMMQLDEARRAEDDLEAGLSKADRKAIARARKAEQARGIQA